MRLLVVEDEEAMARLLQRGFSEEGYVVDVVADGAAAVVAAAATDYDAAVLDVMLPDFDGFEVCARLRESGSRTPVLMLTARDAVSDIIKGLDVGADDYLCKPFSFAELCARVRALTRRTRDDGDEAAQVSLGSLRLDPSTRRVWSGSSEVDLTAKEFVLLELLARHPGRVLSRSEILDQVWGVRFPVTDKAVEQCVRGLRSKLGRDLIETVRGVGYRLRAEAR